FEEQKKMKVIEKSFKDHNRHTVVVTLPIFNEHEELNNSPSSPKLLNLSMSRTEVPKQDNEVDGTSSSSQFGPQTTGKIMKIEHQTEAAAVGMGHHHHHHHI